MTDTKKADQKTERVIFALTPAELAALDKWRYANEIPSRSEAIRAMIRRTIEAGREEKT